MYQKLPYLHLHWIKSTRRQRQPTSNHHELRFQVPRVLVAPSARLFSRWEARDRPQKRSKVPRIQLLGPSLLARGCGKQGLKSLCDLTRLRGKNNFF